MPTTRTLNPLPFLELEPHRFEDLVRQLAYDFRAWRSLEAIGRSGADEGIDIRGIESVGEDDRDGGDVDDASLLPPREERLWIFQCKRERAISPKQVKEIVTESLASLVKPPHGFVLAVGGDVSKKARDAFRAEMVTRNVSEFHVWARGELEDQLFQPHNDRLLFAYFGLSLQTRRRSVVTSLRHRIAIKKQLLALFDKEEHEIDEPVVLLRDPSDDSYPGLTSDGLERGRWLACPVLSAKRPYDLVVARHHYSACVTPSIDAWDADFEHDLISLPIGHALSRARSPLADSYQVAAAAEAFVQEYVDEPDRALLVELRFVDFDQVLAIDPNGDGLYPFPHIFIEFDPETGPFTKRIVRQLNRRRGLTIGEAFDLEPTDATRRKILPVPVPKDGEPLPTTFDATLDVSSAIAISAEKIDTFLVRANERPPRAQTSAVDEKFAEGFNHFERWRQDVALPVFSGFVHALRVRGHRARVVLRSAAPAQGERTESIELRADIVGRHQTAVVRAEFSGYRGWHFRMEPTDPTPTYGAAKPTTMAELDATKLQEKVTSLLKRVAK